MSLSALESVTGMPSIILNSGSLLPVSDVAPRTHSDSLAGDACA